MGLSADELAKVMASLPQEKPGRTAALLLCTVCGTRLDLCHEDLGTHPMCDPTPAPATPPPSILGDVAGALIDLDNARPRSLQRAIGPSQIAMPCERQLAYTLADTPEQPDGRVPWAPMVGTAVHAMLAEAMRADNARLGRLRWLIENRVHPDPSISGECDAYDTDTETVIDWKVVGKTAMEKYRRHGPGQQYEGQAHIYGRGWQRAGRSPKWVRIVFLPRWSANFDDAYEWTAPYSRPAADLALDRMYAVVDLMAALKLTEYPDMWAAVPARPDRMCNYCPFLRPGAPPDDKGCPGDVAADEARSAKFTEGLIP